MRAKLIIILALAAAATLPVMARRQDAGAEGRLQAAINKETVEGDLRAAIELYKPLTASTNRAVAAKALVRMGQCYERLGNTEARKAYEQTIAKFADQAEAVATARARLAAMGTPAASTPSSPPGSLRRVYEATVQPAQYRGMQLSADASRLLFLPLAGSTEFVVRDLVTGAETRVPFPSPDASIPEWRGESTGRVSAWLSKAMLSPDHRQIVYKVFLRDSGKGWAGRGQWVLRVVDVGGAGARQVTKGDEAFLDLMQWKPDGKSVIAVLDSHNGHPRSIVSVRLSDGALTPLSATITGTDDDADWHLSPDGRFVAIWEITAAGYAITIASTRTGQRRRIAGPDETNVHVIDGWAPDGSGLVFMSGQTGTRAVWLQRLSDGVPQGPPEQLRGDLGNVSSFGLGPDGSYYYTKSTQVARRYVAALDPATGMVTGKPELMPDLRDSCGNIWSPDSAVIAYGGRLHRDAREEKTPCTLVVFRTVKDGRERIVSPGMSEIRRPRWSPDGKSLVVFGQKDGTIGVFRLDPETNSARLLVETPANQRVGDMIPSPEWAPDGKGLFLGRLDGTVFVGTYRIVHHDLETGKETERYSLATPGRIWFTTTSVSRDGGLCLMVNEADGSRAAVVVPPGGGQARTVYRVPANTAFSWATWAADGKAIYVPQRAPAMGEPNMRKLLRIPVDGGDPVDAGLALAGLDDPYPSPDGRQLVFGAYENRVEIWVIDRLVPTRAGALAAPRK